MFGATLIRAREERAILPALLLMPLCWVGLVVWRAGGGGSGDSSEGVVSSASVTLVAAWMILGVDLPHQFWSTFRSKSLLETGRLHGSELFPVVGLWLVAGIVSGMIGTQAAFMILAYFTIHHNVRQQLGLLARYRRSNGPVSQWSERLVWAAMWLGVLYWHVSPIAPGLLAYGDLLVVPGALPPDVVGLAALFVAGAALVLEVIQARQSGWVRPLLVLSSVLPWVVAIVVFRDHFLFGAANVLAHSAPYLALVEYQGDRAKAFPMLPALLAYVGAVALAAAYLHLTADRSSVDLSHGAGWSAALALVVLLPLLHYFSDAVVWRGSRDWRLLKI